MRRGCLRTARFVREIWSRNGECVEEKRRAREKERCTLRRDSKTRKNKKDASGAVSGVAAWIIYKARVTRLFMTQPNVSHSIADAWLQLFIYTCIYVCVYECMRLQKIQASSRRDTYHECTWKTLRCLWKEHGRLLVTQRKQWRWRKLIILRVSWRVAAEKEKERRRGREKETSALRRNVDERTGASDIWENRVAYTTPVGCCWRHDFAGRNFAHVLLRKRDESWRWKCVSRYHVFAFLRSRYLNKINVRAKEIIFDAEGT